MYTGTSTIEYCAPFTIPTVTTSCGSGGAGPAVRRPARTLIRAVAQMTFRDFAIGFIRFSLPTLIHFVARRLRPRHCTVADGRAAHFKIAIADRGGPRSGLIGQHREL